MPQHVDQQQSAKRTSKKYWLSRLPDGPLPDNFPLQIASNGQFYIYIKREKVLFGSVLRGWQAARDRYNEEINYLKNGMVPPTRAGLRQKAEEDQSDGADDQDSLDLEPAKPDLAFIANRYLNRELNRTNVTGATSKPISEYHFIDKRNAIGIGLAFLGNPEEIIPDTMTPDQWGELKSALEGRWRKDQTSGKWIREPGTVGIDLFKRRVQHWRSMLLWAGPGFNSENLMTSYPRFGDRFDAVSSKDVDRVRRETNRIKGVKGHPPEHLPYIIAECDTQMKAMVLLGCLNGFSERDCGLMYQRVIDWKMHMIDFDRPKTGEERKSYILPVVEEAIRASLAVRPEPLDPDGIAYTRRGLPPILKKELVFVTEKGEMFEEHGGADADGDGIPDTQSHRSKLARRYDTILKNLDRRHPQGIAGMKFKRPRISFGSLRHTFQTVAARYGDPMLLKLTAGHGNLTNISRFYDHPIEQDMKWLAEFVHEAIFGKGLEEAMAVRWQRRAHTSLGRTGDGDGR